MILPHLYPQGATRVVHNSSTAAYGSIHGLVQVVHKTICAAMPHRLRWHVRPAGDTHSNGPAVVAAYIVTV